MDILEIFAIILGLLGIIGSVVPALPGPPLSWLGLLLLYLGDGCPTKLLLIWLGITLIVTVLDYLMPMWTTKLAGGHKEASWGAVIGLFVGIFLTPIGMLAGSLLGAFIGEFLFARNDVEKSVKAALGAFLSFVLGTGIKLIACGMMFYYILRLILN
ncbi:MAG: DUF456 domain-containing protein [Bacteroidales bacterium]|nr:DUF456 domain-containing protein [Bacteroidales bacterium]